MADIPGYDFKAIEARWQAWWREHGTFAVDERDDRDKYYCLVMFPYPSGTLHVGHGRNYVIGDAVVRYHLMRGRRVLSPMGWDAFGLPAENAAIKAGIHPAESTRRHIARMKEQLDAWGVGYDWAREVASCEPEYYRWTQWLFLQFLKNGLAARQAAPVNWCPDCATVLANEQVHDGACERCGTPVEDKFLEQWFFKITKYREQLLADLESLPGWPQRVRDMQRAWIGRSEGCRIDFVLEHTGEKFPVFTTRPDTVYGVTFMSIAPEHPRLAELVAGTGREKEVLEAAARMKRQSRSDRSGAAGAKEGVFTGRYVVNPLTGDKVPLWVANFVLLEYGTGVVMAVPAHDQRDFEFAKEYDLPIKVVIRPEGKDLDPAAMTEAYVEPGVMANSGPFDGRPSGEGIGAVTAYLAEKGQGGPDVQYRLRDWLISRQRYWGAPIPVVYCGKCGIVPVPEEQLPVLLPEQVDFSGKGESPLARCPEFVNTSCPKCGAPGRREVDTMDTFVCSSWYFLRYLSARDDRQAFDSAVVNRWLPVDQYIGGIEHATMHLIYARFFTKVLRDLGLVDFGEPFANLFTQGMICKTSHRCRRHGYLADEQVRDGRCAQCGGELDTKMDKMSKSKLNVVSPDGLMEKFGADTQRLYLLFVGPPEKDAEWEDRAVQGMYRFLNRLWEAVQANAARLAAPGTAPAARADLAPGAAGLRQKTHATIRKVTKDIEESFHFNTAIAAVMELVSLARDYAAGKGEKDAPDGAVLREALEAAVLLLAPFVPHVAEELWLVLGHTPSIMAAAWPAWDEETAKPASIEIPIQIKGKLRAKITVPADIGEEKLKELALNQERIRELIGDKPVRQVIVVPRRLVNIVA